MDEQRLLKTIDEQEIEIANLKAEIERLRCTDASLTSTLREGVEGCT